MVCEWDAADPHKNKKERPNQPHSTQMGKRQGSTPGLSAGSSTPSNPPPSSYIRQGDKTTYGTGPGVFHFWHALAFLAATDPRRASRAASPPTNLPPPTSPHQPAATLASSSYPHPYDPSSLVVMGDPTMGISGISQVLQVTSYPSKDFFLWHVSSVRSTSQVSSSPLVPTGGVGRAGAGMGEGGAPTYVRSDDGFSQSGS